MHLMILQARVWGAWWSGLGLSVHSKGKQFGPCLCLCHPLWPAEVCHGAAGFMAYRKKLKLILGSSSRSSDQFWFRISRYKPQTKIKSNSQQKNCLLEGNIVSDSCSMFVFCLLFCLRGFAIPSLSTKDWDQAACKQSHRWNQTRRVFVGCFEVLHNGAWNDRISGCRWGVWQLNCWKAWTTAIAYLSCTVTCSSADRCVGTSGGAIDIDIVDERYSILPSEVNNITFKLCRKGILQKWCHVRLEKDCSSPRINRWGKMLANCWLPETAGGRLS